MNVVKYSELVHMAETHSQARAQKQKTSTLFISTFSLCSYSTLLYSTDCQGSSQRSVGKYPVKSPRQEGDSQTIGTYRCRNHWYFFSIIDIFSGIRTWTAGLHS